MFKLSKLKVLIFRKCLIYYYIWHYKFIHTDATIGEQYFTVVAAWGGATFNYFIYSEVVQPIGPQPRGRALQSVTK